MKNERESELRLQQLSTVGEKLPMLKSRAFNLLATI